MFRCISAYHVPLFRVRRSGLLLLTLCTLGPAAIGQSILFTDPTTKWWVADTYPNGSQSDPSFTETRTTAFGYSGDSLIEGTSWSKLVSYEFGDTAMAGVTEGHVFSSGDLVLFMDLNGELDTLYDFSLDLGSSITYAAHGNSETVEVTAVDSIWLAGAYHRVISFQPFTTFIPDQLTEEWIEGIGSIHGPLFPLRTRTFSTEVPGDSLMLTCYAQNGSTIWTHPGYEACVSNIILSAVDVEPRGSDLRPWPNPGTDQFTLVLLPGPHTVLLLDAIGRNVHQGEVLGSPSLINTAHLPPGVYVVRVDGVTQPMRWVKE